MHRCCLWYIDQVQMVVRNIRPVDSLKRFEDEEGMCLENPSYEDSWVGVGGNRLVLV